jgi:hypothetical protein
MNSHTEDHRRTAVEPGTRHPELLAAYALGLFDGDEHAAITVHLTGCAQCRTELSGYVQVERCLAELRADPAAMIHGWGEPEPGQFADGLRHSDDLLLSRILREVRQQGQPGRRQLSLRARMAGVAASVVVLAAAAVVTATAGGLHTHATGGSVAALPPGSRTLSTTSPSGTHLDAALIPEQGWTRVQVHLTGEPANARCELVAVAADGTRLAAGSWAVNQYHNGPDGTRVTGSVAIPLDQVRALQIQTIQGQPILLVTN